MKKNLIIFITYIFLIKYILLTTDYDYYLGQYQILPWIVYSCINLDSSGFKIGEEIYIKITGRFLKNYIEYYFYDDEESPIENCLVDPVQIPLVEYFNKVDKVLDEYGNYLYDIRYFTIDKKKENLGLSNGNMLKIIPYMQGLYDIENTKINQGYARIVGIVIACVVIVVIIIAIIIYCIYRRKRLAQFSQGGPAYNPQNVPVKNMYNNPNYAYPS